MEFQQMFYEARRACVMDRRRMGREGRIAYKQLVARAAERINGKVLRGGCVLIKRTDSGEVEFIPVQPYTH